MIDTNDTATFIKVTLEVRAEDRRDPAPAAWKLGSLYRKQFIERYSRPGSQGLRIDALRLNTLALMLMESPISHCRATDQHLCPLFISSRHLLLARALQPP